jgi:hypothetical protein
MAVCESAKTLQPSGLKQLSAGKKKTANRGNIRA